MTPTQRTNQKLVKLPAKLLPRIHILAVVGLACFLGAMALLPSENASAKRHAQTLDLPSITETPLEELDIEEHTPVSTATTAELSQYLDEVRPGDSLSKLFQRAGLNDKAMLELVNTCPEGKKLAQLYPGHQLIFDIDPEGQLRTLQYVENKMRRQIFTRTDKGFSHRLEERQPDTHLAVRSATISTSLYGAGKAADVDDRLIMELAGIFGWDIDFALDIREGDSFKILFEESFLDGEKIGNGSILAAEFTNRGKTFKAVRYVNSKGASQYYSPTGDTMRKEFLRTPIDFARISSHFNLQRKHPVLNTIRAHKGTDYAAPRGTPIKAAGDGKVIFAGTKGGYGSTVILQHGQTYKTLYAHLSKFRKGVSTGSRVKQGQIIGYVGSTGLATGPHLHYEFYVNGSVRNPVTVKLPKAQAVPQSEMQAFLAQTQPLLAQLEQQKTSTQMASLDAENPEQL